MKKINADVSISLKGTTVNLKISIPDKKTKADVLLDFARDLTNEVVAIAQRQSACPISCCKGCDACCSQLVPVTQVEAYSLASHVEKMPNNKRRTILRRFSTILEKLDHSGLLVNLLSTKNCSRDLTQLALQYMELNISCPFLENGCCSIYAQRPMSCREYLVTSPAENCKKPTKETVHCLDMLVNIPEILSRVSLPYLTYSSAWVPLSVVPYWVNKQIDPPIKKPAREWAEEFIHALSSKEPKADS